MFTQSFFFFFYTHNTAVIRYFLKILNNKQTLFRRSVSVYGAVFSFYFIKNLHGGNVIIM